MKFIKPITLLAAAMLLASCASNGTKQKNADAPVVYKKFSYQLIEKQTVPAADFGPKPQLGQAHAPIPASAQKEFQYAVSALSGGNQDLAEQQLKELIKNYPEFSGPAYNLALLKYQQGDTKAAEEYTNLALERNADNFEAQNLKAVMLREQGKFAEAKEIYLALLAKWGGYAPAYKNLGILNDLYEGNLEKALVYYKQYNAMLATPDEQVHGWVVDLQRRLGIKPDAMKNPAAEPAPAATNAEVTP